MVFGVSQPYVFSLKCPHRQVFVIHFESYQIRTVHGHQIYPKSAQLLWRHARSRMGEQKEASLNKADSLDAGAMAAQVIPGYRKP
jgi:hypothetical protein